MASSLNFTMSREELEALQRPVDERSEQSTSAIPGHFDAADAYDNSSHGGVREPGQDENPRAGAEYSMVRMRWFVVFVACAAGAALRWNKAADSTAVWEPMTGAKFARHDRALEIVGVGPRTRPDSVAHPAPVFATALYVDRKCFCTDRSVSRAFRWRRPDSDTFRPVVRARCAKAFVIKFVRDVGVEAAVDALTGSKPHRSLAAIASVLRGAGDGPMKAGSTIHLMWPCPGGLSIELNGGRAHGSCAAKCARALFDRLLLEPASAPRLKASIRQLASAHCGWARETV